MWRGDKIGKRKWKKESAGMLATRERRVENIRKEMYEGGRVGEARSEGDR